MKLSKTNIILPACLLALLTFSWSCSDNFTDLQPKVQTTEENFYQTREDALLAITAAYDPLQWYYYREQWYFRWVYGDLASDDAIKGGSGDNDQPGWLNIENFNATPANLSLHNDWLRYYKGIFRANIVLEKVPEISMDEDLQSRILAEAKFLRAYFHFELVKLFGDIPLVTTVLEPSEYKSPRTPVESVYQQIEADLSAAANDLPAKSEYSSVDLGRATSGAANALLAKVYLFQAKWEEAKVAAETVINSGEYSLAEDYENIFVRTGENGPGSIFEIQFQSGANAAWTSPSNDLNLVSQLDDDEGNPTCKFQRAREEFDGWGFNIPTDEFINEFESGDPRLNATVFSVGDEMGVRGTFSTSSAVYQNFPHRYYPKKFYIDPDEEPDIYLNSGTNDRVIRYADILLIHAEASYHDGDEAGARNSVNMVRARARRNAATGVLPDITSSGTALRDAIWHERRVELGLEGHRFFDIVRQGRAGSLLRSQDINFVDGVHEVFPIPQAEITLSENAIVQNPGY